MTTTHRHRPHTSEDYGFTGPVSRRENRAAHGNITQWDTCRCGATRATNINGRHIERGEWTPAPMPRCDDARGWDDYRRREGYSGCHH